MATQPSIQPVICYSFAAMLHLYNTLTRRKQRFEPINPPAVSLYVCGITVYDLCHVGHARVMVAFDVLFRHLTASGYAVKYVRNVTDIDDKIIERAAEEGISTEDLTARYTAEMLADEKSLGVLPVTLTPHATEYVAHMVQLIEQLIALGNAYVADNGDVYYHVQSFSEYGKLSGKKPAELRAGERVAISTAKRDPLDFVLWKAAKSGEPSWSSPWGDGRPGWHTECAAMSMDLLGKTIDIHGGGVDLQFPHHENEVAQTEAVTGCDLANCWMHLGFVRIDDEKMSKSLGNFFTIQDVLQRYSGEEIRFFLISSHYRSPVNYSDVALDNARASLRRLYLALRPHPSPSQTELLAPYVEQFNAAMDDDLNTPIALAVLFELASELNRHAESAVHANEIAWTLKQLASRLGLLTQDPDDVLQGSSGQEGAIDTAWVERCIEDRWPDYLAAAIRLT